VPFFVAVHIAVLPAEGDFIMYHTNMASTCAFFEAEGRDELESDERNMMYINFIPIE
jgi:hypothetical protein